MCVCACPCVCVCVSVCVRASPCPCLCVSVHVSVRLRLRVSAHVPARVSCCPELGHSAGAVLTHCIVLAFGAGCEILPRTWQCGTDAWRMALVPG
eukprot:1002594-Rhodomonas_salina.2